MKKEDKTFLALLAFFTTLLSIIAVLVMYLTKINSEKKAVLVELPIVETAMEITPRPIVKKSIYEVSIDYCRYYYAEDLAKAIYKYSNIEGVPVWVSYALFETESELKLNPTNRKGLPYYGLGQLGQAVVTQYNWCHGTNYTIEDAIDLETNVKISIWYFKWCANYAAFFFDQVYWSDAYLVYNAGCGIFKKDPYGFRNGEYTGAALKRFKSYLSSCYDYFMMS